MKSVVSSFWIFFVFLFVSSWANASRPGWAEPQDFFIRFRIPRTIEQVRQYLQNRQLRLVKYYPQIQAYLAAPTQNFLQRPMPLAVSVLNDENVDYFERNQPISIQALDSIIPDDSFWPDQTAWNSLSLPAAWAISTGLSSITVAVVDTGVNRQHQDLDEKIWFNPNEVAGNGVDDDNNRFIDDLHGWNFDRDNNDPQDFNGHGSHVAGIIAAESNNLQGMTGVSWQSTIMPVQFLGEDGGGTSAAAIEAILYAVDAGAKIINASWGGGSKNQAMRDTLRYAHDRGVLVVAAAGNAGQDNDVFPHYPSSYLADNLIAVAASSAPGQLASFSNWGEASVDLVAPGYQILSTTVHHRYERFSGTSMAAPAVSGVAALILSLHPQLNVVDLRNALLNATQHYAAYQSKVSSAGELNAHRALQQFDDGFQVWPSRLSLVKGQSFKFTAYQAQGAVRWFTSNEQIMSIDAQGRGHARSLGQVQVIAHDERGRTAYNQWLRVVEDREQSEEAGCASQLRSQPRRADQAFNFSIPFFAMAALRIFGRRRRRHRH